MATSNPTRPRRLPSRRIIQNFHLVWLDGNFDDQDDDYCNSFTRLRQAVNTIDTFVDIDECVDFIDSIKEETVFMISSGAFGRTAVPIVHAKKQVSEIYIFCGNKARHEQWAKEWPKVKGVFTDIKSICEALKQAAQDCDQNAVSISFAKPEGGTASANKDTLDCSFMYTQILKDILLTIQFDDSHIEDFLTFSRETLAGNVIRLKDVDRLQKEYRRHSPIWWYTYPGFLYSMLNKALRSMDVDIIVKMGFFLRDLHNDIEDLHSKQFSEHTSEKSFVVFRGQSLSKSDFDRLKENRDGLLAFNNFLSTSTDRNVSIGFLDQSGDKSDTVNVLFAIRIDSSTKSTPFANIKDFSDIKEEEELLFSMHSVFRVGQIKKLAGFDGVWEVELTLTSDKDPELRALTRQIEEETSVGAKGWLRLGQLLIKLAQYDKAEELYELLLKQTNDQDEKQHIYHMLGMINNGQEKYAKAVEYYRRSIRIKEATSPNSTELVASYNNIGLVYNKMGEHSKALKYYEKSVEVYEKTLPKNHPDLATSYNNIASVYDDMGEHSQALEYYEKSLAICKKTLPEYHPDLAVAYNNIASVYYNTEDYKKALKYFQRALDIWTRSLPPDHPNIKVVKANIEILKKDL